MNESMMHALRANSPQKFLEAAHQSEGFIPLTRSTLNYLKQGLTSIDEVRRLIEGLHMKNYKGNRYA